MDSNPKKIQIDISMFLDAYRLVERLKDCDIDLHTRQLSDNLERQINAKIEAMKKRDAYTLSKTAKTETEKEQARQLYIELAGIHKDFQYNLKSDKETQD